MFKNCNNFKVSTEESFNGIFCFYYCFLSKNWASYTSSDKKVSWFIKNILKCFQWLFVSIKCIFKNKVHFNFETLKNYCTTWNILVPQNPILFLFGLPLLTSLMEKNERKWHFVFVSVFAVEPPSSWHLQLSSWKKSVKSPCQTKNYVSSTWLLKVRSQHGILG